jgi:hypothetical protein
MSSEKRALNKYGNGKGKSGRQNFSKSDYDDLRQTATPCDIAMICGKARRITAFDDNAPGI